jgi:hypothetical protein
VARFITGPDGNEALRAEVDRLRGVEVELAVANATIRRMDKVISFLRSAQQQQAPVELKDNPSFRKVVSEFAVAKEAIATMQNEIKELHELIDTFRDPTTIEAAKGSEATPPQRAETQMEADFKDLLSALQNRKAGNEGFPFVKDKGADAVIGTLTNYLANILADWLRPIRRCPLQQDQPLKLGPPAKLRRPFLPNPLRQLHRDHERSKHYLQGIRVPQAP